MTSLLTLNIVNGAVLAVLVALSVFALVFLAMRFRIGTDRAQWRRWGFLVSTAAALGALLGALIIFVFTDLMNVFGVPLEWDIRAYIIGTLAALAIGVVGLWRSRWWRKAITVVCIIIFGLTGSVAINQSYGFNPTVASLFNINVEKKIALPKGPVPEHAIASKLFRPTLPLYESWTAPAGMPSTGQLGTVTIPNSASGFAARPAYLYLPPAALVPNPPALPIVIAMMGQPGGPDSMNLWVNSLNAIVADHNGLGPIVLTIDQIGSPTNDPLCIDSPRGNVYTYVMTDVVNFVQHNLHVAQGASNWTVAGYSNGGECALSFGAKHPEVFGSILDVSGEIGPSLGNEATTIKVGFGGDRDWFDREQPLAIMASTHYDDELAIFTSGRNDPYFGAEVDQANAAAAAAGMTTIRLVGTGVGHRSDAIKYGFPAGIPLLYQRWQLTAPDGG